MQGAPLRRPVASVTAMLVMLSGCLAILSSAPATATPVASAARSARSAVAAVAAVDTVAGKRPTPEQRAAARRAAARRQALAERRVTARRATARKAAARRAAARKAAAKRAAARRARWVARWRKVDPQDPRTYIRFAPGHVTPRGGPRFNNPYGSPARRRALLSHVIRSIKASPGYRLPRDRRTGRLKPCPRDPRRYPSEIKVATYSIADRGFADAVIAAHRRCVSVQVLMNSHLTAVTSHAWGRIFRALGPPGRRWRSKRSFARRCSNGCLGTSVLHSKIYLFNRPGRTRYTVMTGSSNMTRNAIGIQWNDLFTVNGNRRLYRQYRGMFRRMVPDRRAKGPFSFRAGPYQSTFYPFRNATRRTDATIRALNTVRCSGARAGSGIKGRTVVYIAMHAWFGKRGDHLTSKVRQLYRRGCYVRILYSFMTYRTYARLRYGTGARMVLRRVLFPGPAGIRAAKYSHMKLFAASGNVNGRSPAWVVWTGSNNWTDRSNRADEVTIRIPSHRVYDLYVRHWKFMRHRRSTRYWAMFQEPEGGGRAP
jgi:phosphatidylserine/phosphatidylglycerophosphate/cardiolipin synthase-like enzyme